MSILLLLFPSAQSPGKNPTLIKSNLLLFSYLLNIADIILNSEPQISSGSLVLPANHILSRSLSHAVDPQHFSPSTHSQLTTSIFYFTS